MANVSSSNGLEKCPKLRFPGFDEPWEEISLSTIFEKNTQKNSDGQITNVICNSAKLGLIPQREYFDKDIANSDNTNGYYIIQQNNFVYNPRKSADAPYGPISRYKYEDDGIVSPLYLCFHAKKEIKPLYYEWYFRSSAWHRYIYMSGDSGARHDRVSIKDTTFFAMPIKIPSEQEQNKIATFLEKINTRIEKQTALVENLKKYKRGLVSDLFSKQKIGFWDEKTLAEICSEFRSGKNIKSSEILPNGDYPVYGGNGVRGFTDHFSHDGEYIIVGRQGALCGNVRIVNGKNYLSEHAIAVKANAENNTHFLLYLLSWMRLGQYSDQGAQPGLAVNKLLRLKCYIPDIKTQEKLVALLARLDCYIAGHENTLNKLSKQKQGLLQKLFI